MKTCCVSGEDTVSEEEISDDMETCCVGAEETISEGKISNDMETCCVSAEEIISEGKISNDMETCCVSAEEIASEGEISDDMKTYCVGGEKTVNSEKIISYEEIKSKVSYNKEKYTFCGEYTNIGEKRYECKEGCSVDNVNDLGVGEENTSKVEYVDKRKNKKKCDEI